MPAKPAPVPTLATRRLTLRQLTPRDLAGLHACFGDPAAMRYWDGPPSETLDDTAKTLRWMSKATSPYNYLVWAVARTSDDACIGMVNYHNREARHRRVDIGYIIAPQHQRRGYAREAVGALIGYCEGTLRVHRMQALIQPENTASIGLVEGLGFVREGGVLRDHVLVGERWAGVMVFGRVG